jgi:hypothetical protein
MLWRKPIPPDERERPDTHFNGMLYFTENDAAIITSGVAIT